MIKKKKKRASNLQSGVKFRDRSSNDRAWIWNCARICRKSWRLTSRADLRVAAGGSEERRSSGTGRQKLQGYWALAIWAPAYRAKVHTVYRRGTGGTGELLRAPRDFRVRL